MSYFWQLQQYEGTEDECEWKGQCGQTGMTLGINASVNMQMIFLVKQSHPLLHAENKYDIGSLSDLSEKQICNQAG